MTKKVKNHFKIAILLETPPRTSLTVYNLQVVQEDKWENISDMLAPQPVLIDHISKRCSEALSKGADNELLRRANYLPALLKIQYDFCQCQR